MKLCNIPDCGQKHHARGLCYQHYRQQYYQFNVEHWREYERLNLDKNRQRDTQRHAKTRKENPEPYRAYHIQWELENSEKMKEYRRNWNKTHRLSRYITNIKQYAKFGSVYGMASHIYRYALYSWSNFIRDMSDNKCVICGSTAKHSHHIFPRAKYPTLSLNLNNGVALCIEHHKEIHRLNGVYRS